MVPTFLAAPRFEAVVGFLVGAALLPARTFFGALALGATALAAALLEALVASGFFSATFLVAEAFAAVIVFAFTGTFLAEVDLADALVEAVFTGRPLVAGFGAATLAGLF